MPVTLGRRTSSLAFVLIAVLSLAVSSASEAGDDDRQTWLAQQEAVLRIIGDFAATQCTELSASGTLTIGEADAKASVGLNKLFGTILDAGLEATIKDKRGKWQGVAQADLAKAYQNKDECHFKVMQLLVPTMIQPFAPSRTIPSSVPSEENPKSATPHTSDKQPPVCSKLQTAASSTVVKSSTPSSI
jgi:hypothetical protein